MNRAPLISRRSFLKTSTTAGAVVALGDLPCPRWLAAAPDARSPDWVDRPMRWAQLTRSDAACLSAGGCVAYYPTKVPLHHRSQWLDDSDPFGELVAGCRKLGMVVIARTDPHATYDDARDAHPDWVAVEPNGNRRRHW